jgi:hypothetical protein
MVDYSKWEKLDYSSSEEDKIGIEGKVRVDGMHPSSSFFKDLFAPPQDNPPPPTPDAGSMMLLGGNDYMMRNHGLSQIYPRESELLSWLEEKMGELDGQEEEEEEEHFAQLIEAELKRRLSLAKPPYELRFGSFDGTFLDCALEWGTPEMVRLLLQHNADPNQRWTRNDGPPLFRCHNAEVAELLLQHNADVNATLFDGACPLIAYAKRDGSASIEVLRLLLEHGATLQRPLDVVKGVRMTLGEIPSIYKTSALPRSSLYFAADAYHRNPDTLERIRLNLKLADAPKHIVKRWAEVSAHCAGCGSWGYEHPDKKKYGYCSACELACYCSTACQKHDWAKRHKATCATNKNKKNQK